MSFFIVKGLSIFLSCMILLNAYIMKRFAKTWVFPSCFFSLFWFAFTFFPLVVLIDIPANPLAILYILFCTVIFSLASLLFDWKLAFSVNATKLQIGGAKVYDTHFLKTIFVISQLFVTATIIINLSINGIAISDYINNFFAASNAYLQKRYSGLFIDNFFFQAGMICNYIGVPLGGLLIVACNKKSNYLYLFILSFLPAMLFMLFYADKGTLPLAIVLFYAGVLLGRIHNNDFSITNRSTNKLILIGLLIVIPLFTISFIARGLYEMQVDALLPKLKHYFFSYAFGHLYAFSDWFTYYFLNDSKIIYGGYMNTLGFYTFTPIIKVLGSNLEVPPGMYVEYFNYKDILTTNIYTIFRGLILDFGFWGSLIFIYLASTFFNLSYYFMLRIRRPAITISIFVLMLGTFYTSFIVSILIWKSIYLSSVLFAFILFLNRIKL